MDLVVRTPRFAQPGETLAAHTFFTAPGGKGANQAVAAGRLGVPTAMVGRVGSDMLGPRCWSQHAGSNGVDIAALGVARRSAALGHGADHGR